MEIKLRGRRTVWANIPPYGDVHLTLKDFILTIEYGGKRLSAEMPAAVDIHTMLDTITAQEINQLIKEIQ